LPADAPARPVFPYAAVPAYDQGRLTGVSLVFPDKTLQAFGKNSGERETRAARDAAASGKTPVFLGAGLGQGIAAFLEASDLPVAVVDRQEPLLAATGVRGRYQADPRVAWIDAPSPELAAKAVAAWLRSRGFPEAAIIADPIQLRLDPEVCRAVSQRVEALHSPLFREAFGYAKFAAAAPRVLLLRSDYFLCREIQAACERLGFAVMSVDAGSGRGQTGFIERFLEAAREFKPDFVITVNHLGLDREGGFTALLERMRLPLASWFVDSPRLILHDYAGLVSPFVAIFTWDKGAVPALREFGFEHVSFLPLATDETRFAPPARAVDADHPWRSRVSFVGESMLRPAAENAALLVEYPKLLGRVGELAKAFAARPEREARELMRARHPEAYAEYLALPDEETRLALELLVTWEATRLYRFERVSRLILFSPLIVGDAGWKKSLAAFGRAWRWHGPIDYYRDLPGFYPRSDINFNCTSMQMKGAVNQRVFDVPACGAFVLTDEREQLAELFEIGKEVIVYQGPEEIEDLVRYYLSHESERTAVAQAGRARVLAEHTYVHRLRAMAEAMRAIYS
jgi:spore maturation protein CgeB